MADCWREGTDFLIPTATLISTPGTRFPRAVREPPRRLCACGVSLGHVFPAGVSHLTFQSTLFYNSDGTGIKTFKLDLVINGFLLFYNPKWIEEISGTPADN
ncbi:hypothetical protein LJR015_003984 [Peribacillus frigoritolerans]|uniref:hypothetical protein n=1 Tax=Peribacillus frigoritolerans TaxID=450367 RepID=UPI003ED0AEEE